MLASWSVFLSSVNSQANFAVRLTGAVMFSVLFTVLCTVLAFVTVDCE